MSETSNHFASQQYGFRRGRSTSDILNYLTCSVQLAKILKQKTIAIFIDIKAAYDNVSTPILLQTLQKFKIEPYVIQFIKEILTNRFIRIANTNFTSITNRRIPEGSPLSPILFNLFLSEIQTRILHDENVKYYIFADKLIISASGWSAGD